MHFIKIGNQELVEYPDKLVFTIKKVMPHKGVSFKFGMRDKIILEAKERMKPLEVRFRQHPNLIISKLPKDWINEGELKYQVGFRESTPMKFYWFFVQGNELSLRKEKVAEGQLLLV